MTATVTRLPCQATPRLARTRRASPDQDVPRLAYLGLPGKKENMVTLREVKASPSGWKDITMETFEVALNQLLDAYRNKAPRDEVIQSLLSQADVLAADDGWTKSSEDEDEDEEDEDNQGT